MDKRLLPIYERELRFLRELAAEFAEKFPKVSARLGITELGTSDPHVERLFQGFALLAGRVRQRLDAEFPAFTETLLDQVCGHLIKPTPSMALIQFQPTANDAALTSGFTLPRGTELRARSSLASGAVCQYRTAHAVELWPIEIESVEYTSVLRSIADLSVPTREPIRALLRIVLRVTGGRSFEQLSLTALPLYVSGVDDKSARLYESLVTQVSGLVLRWGPNRSECAFGDEAPATRQFGFAQDQALLPPGAETFSAYRLLHEYFAFATRFQFVELRGLGSGVRRCNTNRLELILPLNRYEPTLEGEIGADRLKLFTCPAVNLFDRRCDLVSDGAGQELRVVGDRSQPLDYEVHTVVRVSAQQSGHDAPLEYRPLHDMHSRLDPDQPTRQYAIERRPRIVPYGEPRTGTLADYAGSEVYLHLSQGGADLGSSTIKPLMVEALCTNRGLPLLLGHDRSSYFTLSTGAPVDSVTCLVGPSTPLSAAIDGASAWSAISHLHLNYLTLSADNGGGTALREMLTLFSRLGDPLLRREVEGIRAVKARPVTGPYPEPGQQRFVRGLEIELQCEDQAFVYGPLTLASVLAVLFAGLVTPHSFAQTILQTVERGEVYRLPSVAGLRHTL